MVVPIKPAFKNKAREKNIYYITTLRTNHSKQVSHGNVHNGSKQFLIISLRVFYAFFIFKACTWNVVIWWDSTIWKTFTSVTMVTTTPRKKYKKICFSSVFAYTFGLRYKQKYLIYLSCPLTAVHFNYYMQWKWTSWIRYEPREYKTKVIAERFFCKYDYFLFLTFQTTILSK